MNRAQHATNRRIRVAASRAAEARYTELERQRDAATTDAERQAAERELARVARLSDLGNY